MVSIRHIFLDNSEESAFVNLKNLISPLLPSNNINKILINYHYTLWNPEIQYTINKDMLTPSPSIYA